MTQEELTSLQEELRQAVADMRAINERMEAAKAAGGSNPIAAEQLEAAKAAAVEATQKIETLEARIDELENQPAPRRSAQLTGDDADPGRLAAERYLRGQLTPQDAEHLARGIKGEGGMIQRMRAADGAVMHATLATDNTTGHYIILPPAMANGLIELMRTESPMEQICDYQTIEGDTWEQVKVTAGAGAGRVAERATRAATTDPTFGKISIAAHGYYAYPALTMKQVYMSSLDVVGFINTEATEAIRGLVEADYLTGTGVGTPSGILADATLQAAAKASGHASSIPGFDALKRMAYELHENFLANARWMMKRSTELELVLLKDGAGKYILQGVLENQPSVLFGYPIAYNGFMPAVADYATNPYCVAFGDFRQAYKIVANTLVMSLRDEITAPGFVKFYTEIQKGGALKRTDALVLLKIAAS